MSARNTIFYDFRKRSVPVWVFEGASTIGVLDGVSSRFSTLFLFVLRAICDYKDMSICTSRHLMFVVAVQIIEWLTYYGLRC